MFFKENPGKLLTYSYCLVTKGHIYVSKPVSESLKSTKSDVFLKNFFNKFENICTITDAFTFTEEILNRNTSLF